MMMNKRSTQPAVINDDEREIDAREAVVCVSEPVSDQPDISANTVREGEAIVVVGPAVIDDEEEEIDASNADAAVSEVVSDQIDVSTSHAREGDDIFAGAGVVAVSLLRQVLLRLEC